MSSWLMEIMDLRHFWLWLTASLDIEMAIIEYEPAYEGHLDLTTLLDAYKSSVARGATVLCIN